METNPEHPAMIEVFYYEDGLKQGSVEELESLKDKQLWLDITDISKEEGKLLRSIFNIHPLTIEDLRKTNVGVKIEEFEHYMFCTFYGISKNGDYNFTELDFVIGSNFLITNHRDPVASYTLLKTSPTKLQSLFKKGNDFIFHKLLDFEIDNYLPVLENLDEEIDDIEREITKRTRRDHISRIQDLKYKITSIKKITLPQREKLAILSKTDNPFITEAAKPYFRDIYDHTIRAADMIDNYKDAINNSFELYMSSMSNNMNEIMKVLSIFATISLPLTVVSSIYGTNFVHLPGDTHPYGFWIMIGVMIFISFGFMLFFRKKNWI